MAVVAAVAVGLFGLAHLVPGVSTLQVPGAPRGSGSHGAVPVLARYLWVALAATTVGASIFFGLSVGAGALVAMAAGVLGLVVLAIANGVWIHGRPTWTHHAARAAIAAAVVALAAIAV